MLLYCNPMLRLSSISIVQFKNYSNQSFNFKEKVIGICGKNGVGKTNLLDAIHYLCFTKSFFSRIEAVNVQQGQAGFRLEGDFVLNDKKEKALCIFRETGKKEFSLNENVYEKLSQHIGRYTCVMIAPDDAQLITGGSEERRRFLDALLSQLDAEYLQQLIVYNRVLRQRNSLLSSFAETGDRNFSLLDVLNEQLIKPAEFIFRKRKDFLLEFIPEVIRLYHEIAQKAEDISISFESDLLSSSFGELLKVFLQKDVMAQRTTTGIHKDDLELKMNKQHFKNIASQGQRKSLLFALKLTELNVLKNEKGYAPVLLLDDVFEKLDEERICNLLYKVCVENDGQVVITDTDEQRLRSHLIQTGCEFSIISL
jgi:DNA replication and repair protein RecF